MSFAAICWVAHHRAALPSPIHFFSPLLTATSLTSLSPLRTSAADHVRLSARFPWFVSQTDAEEEGQGEAGESAPASESAVAAGDWEIRDPTAALQLVVHWTRDQGWGAGGAVTPRDPPVPCVVMVNASTTVREATALCVRCVPLLTGSDPEGYVLKVGFRAGLAVVVVVDVVRMHIGTTHSIISHDRRLSEVK